MLYNEVLNLTYPSILKAKFYFMPQPLKYAKLRESLALNFIFRGREEVKTFDDFSDAPKFFHALK